MKRIKYRGFLSLLMIGTMAACSTAQPVTTTKKPTETATFTPTPKPSDTATLEPTPTFTASPTPTPDPMGDPDGDGYPTSFEEAWGTDPSEFTRFEDLKNLERSISFILHLREPYNFEDMNATIYQQVEFISEEEIEDHGYFDEGPFKTLTVDVVLFPYVTEIIDNYVKTLSYPYEIPPGLEAFQFPTSTSDSCQELTDVIAPIAKRARTLNELAHLIRKWNHENLSQTGGLEGFGAGNLRQGASITTCQMMRAGLTIASTTRANKNVSDFREAGIPSGVAISFDPTDVNARTKQEHVENGKYRASDHPQTAVWTPRYGFIIHDWFYGFVDARVTPYYVGLFIPIIVPDYNVAYNELHFNSDDGVGNVPRGHPQPDWLFYNENLHAPDNLMPYLEPAEW